MARKTEWFDDEEFWEVLTPFMFGEQKFAAAQEQCDQVLALADPPGIRALDLCCGPGRFSVALARRGYAVTGVDRTATFLAKARQAAKDAGVEVEYVQSDMRDFKRPASFDLVLSMYTSFGYFDEKGEDVQVLQNIHESLADGGKLVIDVAGKEWLARGFAPTSSSALDDGTVLVQRHEIFDDWTRIRNEWIVIRDGKAKTFKFHHTVYSGEELRSLLLHAGFSKVELFGDFDGCPYGLDCRRLLAVAAK